MERWRFLFRAALAALTAAEVRALAKGLGSPAFGGRHYGDPSCLNLDGAHPFRRGCPFCYAAVATKCKDPLGRHLQVRDEVDLKAGRDFALQDFFRWYERVPAEAMRAELLAEVRRFEAETIKAKWGGATSGPKPSRAAR